MQVAKHKVVSIEYTISDDDGETVESAVGDGALSYLHGEGNILPVLESALEGKSAGEQIKLDVPPESAFGVRDDELVEHVSRDSFEDPDEVEVGMQFRVPTEGGETVVTVVEVADDCITVDGNHELAGLTLHFDLKVLDVRDATPEEIDHGHAHGPGGHEHS